MGIEIELSNQTVVQYKKKEKKKKKSRKRAKRVEELDERMRMRTRTRSEIEKSHHCFRKFLPYNRPSLRKDGPDMACKHTSETELSRPRARPGHFVSDVHRGYIYSTHEVGQKMKQKKLQLSRPGLSVRAESKRKKETGYRIKAIYWSGDV